MLLFIRFYFIFYFAIALQGKQSLTSSKVVTSACHFYQNHFVSMLFEFFIIIVVAAAAAVAVVAAFLCVIIVVCGVLLMRTRPS